MRSSIRVIAILALCGLLSLLGANAASATVLRINTSLALDDYLNPNEPVSSSLQGGTSVLIQTTSGAFANTCTTSVIGVLIEILENPAGGNLFSLSFSSCTNEKVVVDKKGQIWISHIPGTRNGTVRSSNAEITVPSPVGALNCKTGTLTDIGTLTEAPTPSLHATIDINAVVNCGFLVPSATWTGTFPVTSPTGLYVEE